VKDITLGQGGGSRCSSAAQSAADGLWLADEGIGALLATGKTAPLVSELIHSDGGELSSSVVFGFVLVDLVDWDGGVDNGWLDGLLLDDWLNALVDMMMDVLGFDGPEIGAGVLHFADGLGVLELSLLSRKTFFHMFLVAMLVVAGLNFCRGVGVLLGENLAVLDGLNGSVVVILMDLSVDCFLGFISFRADYVLMLHCRVDNLYRTSVESLE